jgi:hypothetical protein
MSSNQDIIDYNAQQHEEFAKICTLLMDEINTALPKATSKLYHANPVWFIDENPIVGYDVASDHVNLLFWSGQSFEDELLADKGSFKAAGTSYNIVEDVDIKTLQEWLKKSKLIQWDYKNIVRNKGELHKLSD